LHFLTPFYIYNDKEKEPLAIEWFFSFAEFMIKNKSPFSVFAKTLNK